MQDLASGYCELIQFGVESGNDYIRNTVMSRDMPRETIVNAFKLAKKYGVKTNAINIIGVPGETKEMLLDTVKLNQEINPDTTGVNIFYPYKGTPLGDKSFKEKLVNVGKFNDFSNERRESVMNYSREWLDALVYYRNNWEKLVYPHDYKRHVAIKYYIFKQKIKSIPILGPIITNRYQKVKEDLRMRFSHLTL